MVAGAAGETESQTASKPVWVCFRYFSYLLGAEAHADVAVVLYKALMICKSITTQFDAKHQRNIMNVFKKRGEKILTEGMST